MSEYQYYEFQAIDRPLVDEEVRELRGYSTRARITPTSFVNDYQWGSFKGDEDAWMEKYFDAFLYLANWGTHVLKLRLPARLLSVETARSYCAGERASVRKKGDKLTLSFVSEDEDGEDGVDGDGQLSALISVRAELARGDLRSLYLGWLLCAQSGDLDEDALEPPVPTGLAQLSASQESLLEFLRIDADLVRVAAVASPPLVHVESKAAEVRAWLRKLPAAEKDGLLARLIVDNDASLASEIVQRMKREGDRGVGEARATRRSVGELLREAERAAEARQRIADEQAVKDKARREREAARTRETHLDQLPGKEPALWKKVDALITTKQPASYDSAVAVLLDLRDLAARKGADFQRRVEELRSAHARKPTLIARLQKAGL